MPCISLNTIYKQFPLSTHTDNTAVILIDIPITCECYLNILSYLLLCNMEKTSGTKHWILTKILIV